MHAKSNGGRERERERERGREWWQYKYSKIMCMALVYDL